MLAANMSIERGSPEERQHVRRDDVVRDEPSLEFTHDGRVRVDVGVRRKVEVPQYLAQEGRQQQLLHGDRPVPPVALRHQHHAVGGECQGPQEGVEGVRDDAYKTLAADHLPEHRGTTRLHLVRVGERVVGASSGGWSARTMPS